MCEMVASPAATPLTVTVCAVLHSVSAVAAVKVSSSGSTVAVSVSSLASVITTSPPTGGAAKTTV